MRTISTLLTLGLLGSAACGDDTGEGGAGGGEGGQGGAANAAPALGSGDGSPESVTFTTIADASAELSTPRDLAFNNMEGRTDELWIVNYDTDSTTIVFNASQDTRTSEHRKDGYALHFMAEPAAIAFGGLETTIGKPGTFATCGESRNDYDGHEQHNDFMGPALWSSDLSVYAVEDPIGLGSHLDMLHNSPLCMGIAHETGNVYWAFGGLSGAIFRYDFQLDHTVGLDDHSDGTALQYVKGEVAYAEGVPSHLALDGQDSWLYIADTGNARVARLDMASGVPGINLPKPEPMEMAKRMDGATLETVIPPGVLQQPSGLELKDGLLYVSDHATSRITAFTKDGEEVRHLDTGLPPGSLAGMAFGPDDKLYFVDMLGHRVLRIDPL